jgi:hypothetical protein
MMSSGDLALTINEAFYIPPLGIMMFRVVLLAVLTLALNVAAIAHCRVGGVSMGVAGVGEHQSGTHHQSDCGKSEKRVCDAMVQLTAPDQAFVAPVLVKSAAGSFVFAPSAVTTPAVALSLRQGRPPPNGARSPFKTTYARTGRLLV